LTSLLATALAQSAFEYEVIPTNNVGATTVGAQTGTAFEMHERNAAVQKIDVWTVNENGVVGGDSVIGSIRVTFSNAKSMSQGAPRTGDPQKSITFEQGERLMGDVTMSVGRLSDGTMRLGLLRFTTSMGKMFNAGTQNAIQLQFPSGDSYLMGFFGTAGTDIDRLGLFMMKPLASEKLVNTTYDISPNPNQSPDSLKTEAFSSRGRTDSTVTITYEKVESFSKEWSVMNSFSRTLGIEVSGKIPVVDISISTSIELTQSSESTETSNMVSETKRTEQRVLTNPACTAGTHTIIDFKYRSPIPFKGTLQYRFKDGTSLDIPVDGTLKSTYVSATNSTTTGVRITEGVCGEDVAPSSPIAAPSPSAPIISPSAPIISPSAPIISPILNPLAIPGPNPPNNDGTISTLV
jgi:hypothetical protein